MQSKQENNFFTSKKGKIVGKKPNLQLILIYLLRNLQFIFFVFFFFFFVLFSYENNYLKRNETILKVMY